MKDSYVAPVVATEPKQFQFYPTDDASALPVEGPADRRRGTISPALVLGGTFPGQFSR